MDKTTQSPSQYIVEAEPNYDVRTLRRVHETVADVSTLSDVARTTLDADRNGIYHVTITALTFPEQLKEHIRRNELSIKSIKCSEVVDDAVFFEFTIPQVRGEPYEGTHEGPELGSGLDED